MLPVLWEIPGLGWDIPTYGLALMIAFLTSIWWAARRAMKSQADPDVVLNCGFIALVGGVVGSRVMFVWHYWESFSRRPDFFWALIDVRKGGLEVYGGVIAVVLGVLVYLRLYKHSVRWYLDILAPAAALGMGLGRIGCFFNGCCWGGTCDLPWAVRFPYGSPPAIQQWADRIPGAALPEELIRTAPGGMYLDGTGAQPVSRELFSVAVSDEDIAAVQRTDEALRSELLDLQRQQREAADQQQRAALAERIRALERERIRVASEYFDILGQMQKYNLSAAELRDLARPYRSLPVHPVQLYAMITLVLLAWLLDALYWRRTRDGQVICAFLFVEPLTRWLIEVIRADNPVDSLGAFTLSQVMALALSAAGLLGLIWLHGQRPRSPRATPWEPPPDERPRESDRDSKARRTAGA